MMFMNSYCTHFHVKPMFVLGIYYKGASNKTPQEQVSLCRADFVVLCFASKKIWKAACKPSSQVHASLLLAAYSVRLIDGYGV
jgi:plasmid rolling circle replication initiator protein Rep